LDKYLREVKEVVLLPLTDLLFASISPNAITLASGAAGLGCAAAAASGSSHELALALWGANRLLDGLDGVVARRFNKQSDFGGYLDIVVDFTVYATVPVGLVYSQPSNELWLILAFMLGTFFINAAGLFQLAAILEKNKLGASHTSELTTITMPDGVIEGTETVLMYCLFFLFPSHLFMLFGIFTAGVTFTIVQRLIWAYQHLDSDAKKKT